MKNKTLFGTAITVIMIVLVSIAPSINANTDTLSVETSQEEDTTPIVLVLQLIAKLRNHKEIQNVETEDDVLQIIEGDEELNSIVEQLSVEDCGCESETLPLDWRFPVICTILFPLWLIGILFLFQTGYSLLLTIVGTISVTLGCWWY